MNSVGDVYIPSECLKLKKREDVVYLGKGMEASWKIKQEYQDIIKEIKLSDGKSPRSTLGSCADKL